MPDALVLAGGRFDPAFPQGLPNKAFVPLCGRPMVAFVLEALRAASSVRAIAVAGVDALPPPAAVHAGLVVPGGGSLLDNVAAGLSALGNTERTLVLAADIPLLTPNAVDIFTRAATALDADFVYGVVHREDILGALPAARKTFVRLREGTFTGASLMLVDPRAFARARPVLDRAVRARKRPWELARMFGLRVVAGLLSGRLRISDLERRAAVLAGVRAKALILALPEIALDVDTPEMLAAAGQRLAALAAARSRPAERTARP